jgi:general secretion pathway protein H
MRISVPGSKYFRRGFTLIELLVVVALIAIATATVGLALRDPAQMQLQREAERLIALLETARAEARAGGLDVRWRPGASLSDPAQQFAFVGLPKRIELPTRWLGAPLSIDMENNARELVLGPEPLLPAQGLRLRLGEQQLRIASDGLRPFAVQP